MCEEDDERGEGGDDADAETKYETDEEEFTSAVNTNILPGGSRQDTTPAVPVPGPGPGNCKRAAKRNVSVTSKCNYNLAYFNLWWSRMHREGVKEEKERAQSEEASRRKERLRRMLTRRKTALLSKVTKEKKLNNQMLTEDVPLDGSNIPDYASVSKFGGEGMVVHGDIIYGRSPDLKK